MTDNGISLEDKVNDGLDDISLEAILAEYGDFGLGVPPEDEVGARSRRIVMEALGETFAGVAESAEADDTAGLPDEDWEEPREYQPRRQRKARSRRREREELREYRPRRREPDYAPEPEYAPIEGDEDVKVYRPGMGSMPEGDEDVKVYNLGDVIAEAERRSANWNIPRPEAEDDFVSQPLSYESEADYAEVAAEDRGADYTTDYAGDYAESYSEDYAEAGYRPDAYENIRTGGYGSPDEDEEYAAEGAEDMEPPEPRHRFRRRNASEKQAGPVLGTLAVLGYKLRRATLAGEAAAVEDEVELGPEMPADRAAKYYAANVSSLKLRFRLALLLSVILCWISLGLPTAGALGHDLKTTSLVCLALELSVVMLGLDIFTKGIMSLVRNRPGLWTLVSFSCVASALDAVVSYAVGTAGWGLPFCGAAALSMTFAIWGAQLTARGLRLSCKAQELAEDPFCVSAETGVLDEGAALIKFKRPTTGWLRRCEEPDAAENVFSSLAPWLIAASLLLSVAATAVTKSWTSFFRILAAISASSA